MPRSTETRVAKSMAISRNAKEEEKRNNALKLHKSHLTGLRTKNVCTCVCVPVRVCASVCVCVCVCGARARVCVNGPCRNNFLGTVTSIKEGLNETLCLNFFFISFISIITGFQ